MFLAGGRWLHGVRVVLGGGAVCFGVFSALFADAVIGSSGSFGGADCVKKPLFVLKKELENQECSLCQELRLTKTA